MKRNFPNFLDAWSNYANDNFAPKIYHYWTGISIVAAALERRCWVPVSDTSILFPNLYTFLVGKPASGKSTASEAGVRFIEEYGQLTFVPTQITPAALIEFMNSPDKGRKPIEGLLPPMNQQCQGFWYAGEASNSFEVLHGNIVPLFTDWYGCPSIWSKEIKKDGEAIVLNNLGLNILACTTQNYLSKLIPYEDIMGGFASRIMFIIHDEVIKRKYKLGGNKSKVAMKASLMEDFAAIHHLRGEFQFTDSFSELYSSDAEKFNDRVQETTSEKLQGLLGRKITNVLKLAMIVCVSESNDMLLDAQHWTEAKRLYETVEANFGKIIHLAADSNMQPKNTSLMVTKLLAQSGGYMPERMLRSKLLMGGIPKNEIDTTIQAMVASEIMATTNFPHVNGTCYKLLIEPGEHV